MSQNTLMRKILPFENKPLVCCYHNMAFPLGIIQANSKVIKKDCAPWLIDRYINCAFNSQLPYNKYTICLDDWWGLQSYLLLHQHLNFYKSIFIKLNIGIIDLCVTLLNENCYIGGEYNEKYIPDKKSFNKKDFVHDYIIYGYDLNSQVFYSSAYLKNKEYLPFEIPFKNFQDSLLESPVNRIEMDFWKYNPNFEFRVDLVKIRQQFSNYLNSIWNSDTKVEEGKCYGINANRELKSFISGCSDCQKIDLRYMRAYMEHKSAICMCLEYLAQNDYIKLEDSIKRSLREINAFSKTMYSRSIEYNITQNIEIKYKIIDHFDIVENSEKHTFPLIIDKLSKIPLEKYQL